MNCPKMETVLFDLKNIDVSYQQTKALKNISLQVREGEKIALIGPSGAGKTTLLRKLYESNPRHCAIVHQDYALVSQLSAFHNVYIGRLDQQPWYYNVLNLIKPQLRDKATILPILESLGIREKAFKAVGSLSGGQQQRVAIARALYRESKILLGDEPVSSVDPHFADKVLQLIQESRKTVILTLHSVELALRFSKRIIGVRSGGILFDLPVKEVNDYHLSTLFKPC